MDPLEYEISQRQLRLRQTNEWGAPGQIKIHHADPSALLWYSAAVVIVCLGWLSYMIFS